MSKYKIVQALIFLPIVLVMSKCQAGQSFSFGGDSGTAESSRNDNPWALDADPSSDNRRARYRDIPATTATPRGGETVWINKEGVIYEAEDMKAFDRSEYE